MSIKDAIYALLGGSSLDRAIGSLFEGKEEKHALHHPDFPSWWGKEEYGALAQYKDDKHPWTPKRTKAFREVRGKMRATPVKNLGWMLDKARKTSVKALQVFEKPNSECLLIARFADNSTFRTLFASCVVLKGFLMRPKLYDSPVIWDGKLGYVGKSGIKFPHD